MSRLSAELRADLDMLDDVGTPPKSTGDTLDVMVQRGLEKYFLPKSKSGSEPRSLEDWAVAEAARLFSRKKHTLSMDAAAQAAARRAPGMKAAAEAFFAILHDDTGADLLIPAKVAAEVRATAAPSSNHIVIERVKCWLTANEHALKSCTSGLAAIAASAPVALIASQQLDAERDLNLEKLCKKTLTRLKRKATTRCTARPTLALPARHRRRVA